jgi:hypothetical protein
MDSTSAALLFVAMENRPAKRPFSIFRPHLRSFFSSYFRSYAIELGPGGAILLGLALWALILAAMLIWWYVFGFWETLFDPAEPFGISYDGRSHITMDLVLAYLIVGGQWVRREEFRALEKFGVNSSFPPEVVSEKIRQAYRATLGMRLVSVSIASMLGISIIALTAKDPGIYLRLESWNAHHVWAIMANVVLFSSLLQYVFVARVGRRTLETILNSLPEVDLLDRAGTAQIGRFGFPSAFLWLVGSSISSSLAWGMETVWPLVGILLSTFLVAGLSLVSPVQIVHVRLHAAKRAELERVRKRIASTKEVVLAQDCDDQNDSAASALMGLIAYESRVESVREWPFDIPTLLRIGFLALLAMGSWLGGAVVERVLGVVLE